MKTVFFEDLGAMDYKACWDLQESIFSRTVSDKLALRDGHSTKIPEHHLLFCEHPHVITLGKSGKMENLVAHSDLLREKGVSFYKINRGGDITYHGPGQVIGYPILDLDQFFTDIHRFMRLLEETIIRTLAEYGIEGDRLPGATGVWLDPRNPFRARKICAFGIRCSRWVTMHGWALNVNSDLQYFDLIVPCGISDKKVTSMEKELGRKTDTAEVKAKLQRHFAELFDAQLVVAKISRDAHAVVSQS
jgi:lipoyl(octanoyl) transferase